MHVEGGVMYPLRQSVVANRRSHLKLPAIYANLGSETSFSTNSKLQRVFTSSGMVCFFLEYCPVNP